MVAVVRTTVDALEATIGVTGLATAAAPVPTPFRAAMENW